MLSLSIVTPSFNQGRYLDRTIRSVLDQDVAQSHLEYIVCDGGSTDASLDVLGRYSDRVRWLSEPDSGQAAAVNKGIRLTTGDVIGWLNSDDVYAPSALAAVTAYLAAHPRVDLVYGDARLIDADDAPIGTYGTEPWNPARLPQRCFLCQPAVFFRRRVVDRFGLLDERLHYCLDYEYWLRLAEGRAVFAYLPAILASSRVHPETKTLRARLALHDELNRMLLDRLGRVPDSWLINHAHTLVELRSRRVVPYAAEVIATAIWLSWRWNHGVPPSLLASLLGPLAAGVRRRAAQSRAALTRRPAS